MSVARRIANEFDDAKVVKSVGFEVRGGNKVNGSRIMIMTDAALIRMAQHDRLLKRVGVLIIDEAHERSLNTDIVVGIAKTVIQQRPDDFKVVIASATINPKPFLEFFFGDSAPRSPLTVPGRVFPVTTETRILGKNDDSSTVLAKEVVKALKKHADGHCLVFLQGSREVDAAIAAFQKLAPSNWKALPLYGALSPDEQNKVLTFDDNHGTLRMVVFCTNVAETSLTVPGVRLVMDTGLAKECRYDAERRITILEEVYISRSSAEQRKGRAGRTAEGHCVRLYPWATLNRENIEPEILRSSLDLVMLQVCSLCFDPLEFDFISRPGGEAMANSLTLLTGMGCLTPTFALTERGLLFNNLPFDPRLSYFVVLANENFGQGPIAAAIASILSARGSILFFGNTKDGNHKHVVRDSCGLSSDLLHLLSVYKAWLAAGAVDRFCTCCSCRKSLSPNVAIKDGGCRPCRIRHSQKNSLNNKVLEAVRGTVAQMQKEIPNWNFEPLPDSHLSALCVDDIEQIIGLCLAQSFPEQVCEFLMPSDPTVGVYSIASDLKGHLSYTSTLRVAFPRSKYLIVMSQTRLPSGLLLMDMAHLVSIEWMPLDARLRVQEQSLNTVECFKKQNVSGRYCSLFRKYFGGLVDCGEQFARFVVCQYDVSVTTLSVFAPRVISAEVKAHCEVLMKTAIEEDLAQEVVVDALNAFATLTVAAGFNIKKIETGKDQPCRVHFVNPPVKSHRELLDWACKIAGCKASDIKWHSFIGSDDDNGQNGPSTKGIVVFRNENFAQASQKNGTTAQTSFEDGSYRALVKSFNTNLEALLHSNNTYPSKVLKIRPLRCQLQVLNVPEHMNEQQLRMLFQRNKLSKPSFVTISDSKHAKGTRNAIVSFDVQKANDTIISKCQMIPELNCRGKFCQEESIVFFRKCDQADDLYRLAQNRSEFAVDGTAVFIVAHPELFLLEQHLIIISSVHRVKFKKGRMLKKGQEVIFSGNLTSKCDEAARVLQKIVEPIKYFFGMRDKRLMAAELLANGNFQSWAEELELCVEERNNQILIFGEKYEQGQFMSNLAEYYDEFMTRYHLLVLSPSANCLFRKGNPGEAQLQIVINSVNSDEVQICYQGFLSSIEIAVRPNTRRSPSVIIDECVTAINGVLSKFNQVSTVAKNCVYCNIHPGRKFRICGHPFCKECLQQATTMQLSNFWINKWLTKEEAEELEKKFRELFGSCPSCKTPINIEDLSCNLTRSTMEDVSMAFAQVQLRREDHPMGMCPVSDCGAFIPKQNGYSSCPSCKQYVCPKCGSNNDDRHCGITCEEYDQFLKKGTGNVLLRSIVSNAEKYARSHFMSTVCLGISIKQIDINPGLNIGCMALQRYCAGIQRIGLNELQQKSVFAWHGTSFDAIPAICNDGFDPKRRSRQVYGPGEYFGLDARVSIGYTKNCERLIVVQIIKCSVVKTVTSLGYVVDNPTDWSYCFNLPLLVVTYGPTTSTPIPWILTAVRPLPYPFDDSSPFEENPAHPGSISRSHFARTTPAPTTSYHLPTSLQSASCNARPILGRANIGQDSTHSYGGSTAQNTPKNDTECVIM